MNSCLSQDNKSFILSHVQVVLNSKKQNGWETELRTPLPTFVNGRAFEVQVKCLDGEFEIYQNGKVGSIFRYFLGKC